MKWCFCLNKDYSHKSSETTQESICIEYCEHRFSASTGYITFHYPQMCIQSHLCLFYSVLLVPLDCITPFSSIQWLHLDYRILWILWLSCKKSKTAYFRITKNNEVNQSKSEISVRKQEYSDPLGCILLLNQNAKWHATENTIAFNGVVLEKECTISPLTELWIHCIRCFIQRCSL